jgi:hypothetical protein
MRVWLVEPDGSYIDETEMDKVPAVGETVSIDTGYKAGEISGRWRSAPAGPPRSRVRRRG